MKLIFAILCFQLIIPRIFFTDGLECPTCLQFAASNNTPATIRDILNTNPQLMAINDVECEKNVEERTSKIQTQNCGSIPGKVSKCGFYNGSFVMSLPFVIPEPFVQVKLFQRGCYDFPLSDEPPYGCQERVDVSEDVELVNGMLSTLARQVALLNGTVVKNMNGELCLIDTNEVPAVDTSTKFADTSGVGTLLLEKSLVLFTCVTMITIW